MKFKSPNIQEIFDTLDSIRSFQCDEEIDIELLFKLLDHLQYYTDEGDVHRKKNLINQTIEEFIK